MLFLCVLSSGRKQSGTTLRPGGNASFFDLPIPRCSAVRLVVVPVSKLSQITPPRCVGLSALFVCLALALALVNRYAKTNVQITFDPIDGTDSTLEAADFGLVRLVDENLIDIEAPETPIDPARYRLTTPEGMLFELNQGFIVQRVIEPNGTALEFSDNGIEHSQGFALEFVRDLSGRITNIIARDGSVLSYQYDAAGDLISSLDRFGVPTQ